MNFTEQEAITLLEAEEKRRHEQEECDHDDVDSDDYTCVTCGKDLYPEYAARAYDRAKDRRKYGDT